jgi:hypothetical protein
VTIETVGDSAQTIETSGAAVENGTHYGAANPPPAEDVERFNQSLGSDQGDGWGNAPADAEEGGPAVLSIDDQDAYRTLAQHWDNLRGGDQQVSRHELEQAAKSTDTKPDLKNALDYLLSHPDALNRLDTAAQWFGGPDNTYSTDDLTRMLQDVELTPREQTIMSDLREHWDTLRGDDHIVSRQDLQNIAESGSYASDITRTAQYLLDHPELFDYRLDVADQGGRPDGKISTEDLTKTL